MTIVKFTGINDPLLRDELLVEEFGYWGHIAVIVSGLIKEVLEFLLVQRGEGGGRIGIIDSGAHGNVPLSEDRVVTVGLGHIKLGCANHLLVVGDV